VNPRFAVADALTALRFAARRHLSVRALARVAARDYRCRGRSDVADGFVARRLGASRAGAVLDPVADKLFMAVAFVTIARRGLLAWYETDRGAAARHPGGARGSWPRGCCTGPSRCRPAPVAKRSLSHSCSRWWAAIAIGPTLVTSRGPPRPLQCTQSGITGPHGSQNGAGRPIQSRNVRNDEDRSGMRIVLMALVTLLFAVHDVQAQQFQPPKNSKHGGTRFGLFGFGVRGGVDFRRSGQLVLGTTLDIGDLFSTNRLGSAPPRRSVCSMGPIPMSGVSRRLWRFHRRRRGRDCRTSDWASAWPVAMHAAPIPGAPVSGSTRHSVSSLHYRSTFNWLLEYHGMDRCAGNRLFIGLTTRRGN